MTTLIRLILWLCWAGMVAWLWQQQIFGAGSALAATALGLAVFAWPSGGRARRRRMRSLRYVEVAKQPIGLR